MLVRIKRADKAHSGPTVTKNTNVLGENVLTGTKNSNGAGGLVVHTRSVGRHVDVLNVELLKLGKHRSNLQTLLKISVQS
mgnify:CR=1 FL=1